MAKQTKNIEIPESILISQNQVRKLLRVRKAIVVKLVEIGLLKMRVVGSTYYFNYFQVKQFAEDLFDDKCTIGKTKQQRDYLRSQFKVGF